MHGKPGKQPAPHCSSCGRELDGGGQSEGPGLSGVYLCRICLPEGDDCAGTLVGDYELRRVLGAGSMSTTYLAWHHRTNMLVALRQLRNLGSELLARRFETEVRELRRLSHPGISRFIDSGIQDGAPFTVTEYVAGPGLEDWRRAQALVSKQIAVRVIARVLGTLRDAHEAELIHRDIKPRNILIAGAEDDPVPKLIEFGMALHYECAGAMKAVTPAERLEAIRFAAPERTNASHATVLSDLYSAGATLYYLVSGHLPFDFPSEEPARLFENKKAAFRSPLEAARALRRVERMMYAEEIVKRETPVPVLDRNHALPEKLAQVIDRAVSKEPKARFQTAAEFRDALLNAAVRDGIGA